MKKISFSMALLFLLVLTVTSCVTLMPGVEAKNLLESQCSTKKDCSNLLCKEGSSICRDNKCMCVLPVEPQQSSKCSTDDDCATNPQHCEKDHRICEAGRCACLFD